MAVFWDRVAGVYDIFVYGLNRKCNRTLCLLIESSVYSDDEVLECACGTGMLTESLAARCRFVLATDYSEKMLERARKKLASKSNVRFEAADITALPYADHSFDRVVAANVIHLLDDPKAALSELLRVCRPGGQLIIPTYVSRAENGRERLLSRLLSRIGVSFKNRFSYESYQQFIREAGYEDAFFVIVEGRIPCALAYIPVPEEPAE